MLARLRRSISASLYGGVLPQDMSPDERRTLWPPAPELGVEHVQNCRVLPSRLHLLDAMPRGGVCAEVGIFLCDFSAEILSRMHPAQLHLLDIDEQWFDVARKRFPNEITGGEVILRKGDSSTILRSFPSSFFDWIYVDGDHSYDGCKRDLEAAAGCLKPGGVIALNDYTFWGASDFCKYGVMEAVNEFCLSNGFELIFLALQGRGYHDVAIRKIAA